MFIKTLLFLKNSKVLKGFVKDITITDCYEGSFKVPVVEYYDNEEKKSYTFQSSLQNIKYKIGDKIEIRLYKKGSKRICDVNRPFMLLMGRSIPLIMGILGYIIFLIDMYK